MQRIVGIDLGTYSIKVVHIEPRARGGYDVIKLGEAVLSDDAERPLADRQHEAMADLKSRGLLDGDAYVTSLSGDTAAIRTLRMPLSDPKKLQSTVPFALESEIPLDLEDIVLSWTSLGKPRGKKDDKNPNESDVLVAYAKKEAVAQHLAFLATYDIDPKRVCFAPLALGDVFEHLAHEADRAASDKGGSSKKGEGPSELVTPGGTVIETADGAPEPATAIVDIGHRSTSVCIMAGGRVISAQSILHGGADATRALAKAIGLPIVEAERGKRKEAFIEVTGTRAQFPEQQHISDTLKLAYAPIVKRLRQLFQASISQARARVVKVVLVGGGGNVLNLERHLAEELNVRVQRFSALSDALKDRLPLEQQAAGASAASQFASAFAAAVSVVPGVKEKTKIDLRAGEFAYSGDFDFIKDRVVSLAAWAAVILVLFLASGMARVWVLGKKADALDAKVHELCKQITGTDIPSTLQCMSEVQAKAQGGGRFGIPERSAADTYLEIAYRFPKDSELKRKVLELDITDDRVRIRGTTSNYEAVDTLVEKLTGGRCFSVVEKGKLQNKGDLTEFNITMTLDCQAAPGDEKAQNPPEGKAAKPVRRKPAGLTSPTWTPPVPASNATAPVPTSGAANAATNNAPSLPAVAEPAAVDGDAVQRPGKITPQELDERRERLRKLREERDVRRKIGDSAIAPLGNRPALRERLKRTKLGDRGDDAANAAEGDGAANDEGVE